MIFFTATSANRQFITVKVSYVLSNIGCCYDLPVCVQILTDVVSKIDVIDLEVNIR